MDEQNALLLWQKTCDNYLINEVPSLTFNTWFKPVKPSFDNINQVFLLEVPNQLTRDFLTPYHSLIENALSLATSIKFNVEIQVEAPKQPQLEVSTQPTYSQHSKLNPDYTFDSFIVGDGNRLAHAAACAVASMSKNSYNPLFLYGGSGLGKTHLMQAIGNEVKRQFPDKNIVYVSTESFSNEFIEAIKQNNFDNFRNKYRKTDLLLIDDIQFLENKDKMQEEFFHTFNALFELGKKIVITCDKRPQSLATLEDRLKTRIGSGISIDIKPPDYETRLAILKNLAQMHHADVPNDVFDYIAKNISSNIRELEGAFKTLIAYTMLGYKINLETAQTALKDLITPKQNKQISPELIMSVVANYYQINVNDLKSKKRSKEVVLPRQVAMYLCRNLLNMTFKDIGDFFAKNHATVIHAYDKTKEEIAGNSNLEMTIKNISERLRE